MSNHTQGFRVSRAAIQASRDGSRATSRFINYLQVIVFARESML